MLSLAPFIVTLAVVQQVPKKDDESEEEVVAGLPSGDSPPLPDRVQWDFSKAVIARTATRARLDLAGFWRFAAIEEIGTAVKRSEMGWISLPGQLAAPTGRVFDARFRATDGLWRGKPIERFPYFWVERDISITNATVVRWLNRRVFLVLSGPWAAAEVFTSQRFPKSVADQANDFPQQDADVHVEAVTGTNRDGLVRCEITEQLVYPGTTQLSLRVRQQAEPDSTRNEASLGEPYVGIEFVPTGPRIEHVRLRRAADSGQVVAEVDLLRPKGFLIFPGPPVRKIPMSLKIQIEEKGSGQILGDLDREIGPMADLDRSVTLGIPWSPTADPAAARLLKISVALLQTGGGIFDEAFPIEFRLADLVPVN